MNRSEKRRSERLIEKKQKVYTLTQAQIDKLKEDATMEATKRAFSIMLGFPLLALRDTFGFGKKRLTLFTDKVFEIYEAYNDDYIDLEDLHRTIEEETGVVIKEVSRN